MERGETVLLVGKIALRGVTKERLPTQNFKQYAINEKNCDDQPNLQLIRVCPGSTCDGPFPFIPLIKNVMTSLMVKYYDAYIPTASTNTELPLTISL